MEVRALQDKGYYGDGMLFEFSLIANGPSKIGFF